MTRMIKLLLLICYLLIITGCNKEEESVSNPDDALTKLNFPIVTKTLDTESDLRLQYFLPRATPNIIKMHFRDWSKELYQCMEYTEEIGDYPYIRENLNARNNKINWIEYYKYHGYPSLSLGASSGDTNATNALDFTSTNIQESGVDEADRIKNDNKYIYIIKDNKVQIIDAYPPEEMRIIYTIDVQHIKNSTLQSEIDRLGNPFGLLIDNERLLILSKNEPCHGFYGYTNCWETYSPLSSVLIYDISNREAPELIGEHYIQGTLLDVRLIDHKLYAEVDSSRLLDHLIDLIYKETYDDLKTYIRNRYIEQYHSKNTLDQYSELIKQSMFRKATGVENDEPNKLIYTAYNKVNYTLIDSYEKYITELKQIYQNGTSNQKVTNCSEEQLLGIEQYLALNDYEESYEEFNFFHLDSSTEILPSLWSLQEFIDKNSGLVTEYLKVRYTEDIMAKFFKNYHIYLSNHSNDEQVDGISLKNMNTVNKYVDDNSLVKIFKSSGLLVVNEFSGNDYEKFNSEAIITDDTIDRNIMYASKDSIYIWNEYYYQIQMRDMHYEMLYYHSWMSDMHRFGISNGLKYIASNSNVGIVPSSYALSEYNGYLRIFEKKDGYVLLELLDINNMQRVGMTKLNYRNESIYASRFIGDKAYLVTFKVTDPVFTFDLSDPTKPKNLGELKINGYSTYIQPLDDKTLLTIGRDATKDGALKGVHLQMFDVSDMKNPKRTQQELIFKGNARDSIALRDKHAITYHHASGLLGISYSYFITVKSRRDRANGFVIYQITPDKQLKHVGQFGPKNFTDIESMIRNENYNFRKQQIKRSVLMFKDAGVYDKNVYLYLISGNDIKALNALNPDEIYKEINF